MGIGSAIGGLVNRSNQKSIQRNQRTINRLSRETKTIQAIQQRRAFVKQARLAQAAALAGAETTGAGAGSSASLANQASLQTQSRLALTEFDTIRRNELRTNKAQDMIYRNQQTIADVNQAGEIIDTMIQAAAMA